MSSNFQLIIPAPRDSRELSFGGLRVWHSDEEISSIHYFPAGEVFPQSESHPKNELGEKIMGGFRNYLDNPSPAHYAVVRDLPCRFAALDERAWKASAEIRKVPYGETAAYGKIAGKIGEADRYPGRVCEKNPFAIVVPCFRIIYADSTLSGFKGNIHMPDYENSLKTKAWFLEREGLEVVRVVGKSAFEWKVRRKRRVQVGN